MMMMTQAAPAGSNSGPPPPQGVDAEMRDLLLGAIPALRAFAFSLTYDLDRSDDLVQDTLVRAWVNAGSFRRGTNLTAWLFTILRNLFYSEQRKRKREVEDADGVLAGKLTSLPEQEVRMEMAQFQSALNRLPHARSPRSFPARTGIPSRQPERSLVRRTLETGKTRKQNI